MGRQQRPLVAFRKAYDALRRQNFDFGVDDDVFPRYYDPIENYEPTGEIFPERISVVFMEELGINSLLIRALVHKAESTGRERDGWKRVAEQARTDLDYYRKWLESGDASEDSRGETPPGE
jgi:hypothetical protein